MNDVMKLTWFRRNLTELDRKQLKKNIYIWISWSANNTLYVFNCYRNDGTQK